MGEVLLAQDVDLGRRVAFKRPFKSALEDGLARFQVVREAPALLKETNGLCVSNAESRRLASGFLTAIHFEVAAAQSPWRAVAHRTATRYLYESVA
jgi:hypothetical protein